MSSVAPFFTTKAPGRGTGIGLQTVHGIVTQMRHGTACVFVLERVPSFVREPPAGLYRHG